MGDETYAKGALRLSTQPFGRRPALDSASYFAMYEVFINNIIDIVAGQASSQKYIRTLVFSRVMLIHIMRNDRDFNPSNASVRNIFPDLVIRPEYTNLYLRTMQSQLN